MGLPLLQSKLFVPPVRPALVPRPRLIERLNAGVHRRLTLIAAPAGFGKTTLASTWVRSGHHPVAWLSLDEEDRDLSRFLTYLVAALRRVARSGVKGVEPTLGEGVWARLQASQPPPTESILTLLLNEMATRTTPLLLVLDDYHTLAAPPVDEALSFLLAHLPPPMHLVILTREDPPLPILPRLRVRDQLTEVRAADLRFQPDEAATFLNRVMGLTLSAEEIATLERRTEGWIAGLQMAALSMQGHTDPASFIEAFTGSHRFVLDYLMEEVLHHQPENVRRFLIQTSILDRLSGPLCDAVTAQTESQAVLESLERGNLFVVPLDEERRWYRYHHLFADMLQARLREEEPGFVALLHGRASAWHEANGSVAVAIHHALAAEDWERGATLLEGAWPQMEGSFLYTQWLAWASALPEQMIRMRPVLSANHGWALLNVGELEASQPYLQAAERWLDALEGTDEAAAGMIVADEAQLHSLPATIAAAYAFHAQAMGDGPGAVAHTHRVLDLLPAEEHHRRGHALMFLTLAQWADGALTTALNTCREFMALKQRVGDEPEAISATFVLADIHVALGRLHEARRTYELALKRVARLEGPPPPGTQDLHRGLGDLYREWGDIEAATEQLQQSKALGEEAEQPDWRRRLAVTEARLRMSQGDIEGALSLLAEAEQHAIRTPLPDVHPIPALRARLQLPDALSWARTQGLSPDDDLSYLREFEHLTLARLLIAQYRREGEEALIAVAVALLERLRHAAEAGGRVGSAIEALMLQALAHEAEGNIRTALVPLERALTLAEPEGYVRRFVDTGRPMAILLREAAGQGVTPIYTARLLAALGATAAPKQPLPKRGQSGRRAPSLVEPLTRREMEVLRMLATELSGPEIASELMISLNTMRSHTKNIYGKLDVNSRRAAVRRAEELALL